MKRLTMTAFAAAALVLVGAEIPQVRAAWPLVGPLVYGAKPLATILIGWLAFRADRADLRYRRLVLAGLGWSLAGDVFLMLPGDWFVPGLASFLAAHLCYVAAFAGGRRFFREWRPLVPLGLFAAGFMGLLWGGLGGLRIPVAGYVGAIVTMAWQAAGRALDFGRRGDRLAAAGALSFVASDSLLAWNRFHEHLAWAGPVITLTYLAAQAAIARSVTASTRR